MMLVDYIDRGVRIAPNAPCMILPDGTVAMTHAEFHELSHRIAGALIDDGLQPGDRVAVFSPNDPMAFACLLGIMRAGGVWTAVNAANREEELAEFLTLVGCTRLFYHPALLDRAENLINRIPIVRTTVALGPGRPGDPVLTDWMAPEATRTRGPAPDSSRPVMLMGTGGTTGRPKAVPLSNRQLHLMSAAFDTHLYEPGPPRYICATPMTHAAGGAAFPVLAHGGTVIVHNGVDPAAILASIEHNRATRIFLPPTALYALLARPEIRDHDYSSLRQFLVSAAPVAPERLAEAVDVFGPVMAQVFGQSEAPFICAAFECADIAEAVANPALRHRLASCGRPSIVARVEIMGEDGELCGPGERGEVVVRSDLVFAGYWENPAATAETRRPDGWHGTGDIGMRDEDGFLYIVDRKKDMIITGGFNVFPSEIEAVIHTFPEVNDCAVIGLPDPKWGEAVTAVIESKADRTIDEAAVLAACRERLGPVKTPKRIVVRELPRSAAGKVLKRQLRDEYWTGSSRMI
jgi:acyl-CoA synthetase (AMP-forming)/AMP-acid ligase II